MGNLSSVRRMTLSRWWRRTAILALGVFVVLGSILFAVPYYSAALDAYGAYGSPSGFHLTAYGVPVVFIVLVFWFARAQHAIDRKFGVAEDD